MYSEPGVDEDDGPAGDDRWGDAQPPIRQRPPGLAPEGEPDEAYEAYEPGEAYEDSDTLLFDHRRPSSRRDGSRRDGSGRRSRRTMRIAVPVIVVVAVAALALALLTGHGPKLSPATSDQHKTPNTAAPRLPLGAVTFDTYPGQQQRGVFQVINRIVAVGSTMVTTGSQTSDGVVRQQFLVSANAGASWHLAPVHSPGGGQAALGHPATLLAGGPGGWVATGPKAIWTSPDGLTWTLAATHGITPRMPGDVVWAVNKTSTGYLAAGIGNGPGQGQHTGVIWTSRDGLTWQRATAAQLRLAGPGETVRSISYVTSRGNATVISGAVTAPTGTYSAAWLSTNGGTAWTRLKIPADHGAGTTISGVASDGSGLIAVRPGRTPAGAPDGIAYFSADGRTWQYAATIEPDPNT
ncbi:MAG TPA: sialidase family protein, partial [Streptosporangiaceae bacterium]